MYIPAGITTSDIGSISGTGADNRIPTFTDATNIQGEANLTFDGSTLTVTGAVTVGSDGSGQDVTFYSETAGDHFVWDASAEKLTITGTNGATALDVADGNVAIADDLDVDGTANLDAVDIDGAVNVADDLLVTLGTNNDSVFTHQNSALGIHAELSNVVEGTSAHPAYAANSLLISNITDDGDIGFLTSDGGNSRGLLTLDGSAGKVVMMTASTQTATPDYSGAVGAELYLQSNATGGGVGTGGTLEFGTTFGNGTPFAMIKGYVENGTDYTTGILMFSVRDATDSVALTKAMQISSNIVTTFYGDVKVQGTTPSITIGDTGDEDAMVIFDTAHDFYMGSGATENAFTFGSGTSMGSNMIWQAGTSQFYFVGSGGVYVKDDINFYFGTGADYKMEYESSNTRWVMWSNNMDGSGTNSDIIRIDVGQAHIDALDDWVDDGFDIYDDAILLASSHSPTAEAYNFGKGVVKKGREALIEAGVLKRYEDGWVGYNDQRMAALLAGGIYQTRWLVDEMKEKISELENKVKALGG